MPDQSPEDAALRRSIVDRLKEERWTDALSLLERWCDDHPDDGRAWLNRAYCLSRLQQLDEALACAERAVEVAPDLGKAVLLRDQLRRHLAGNTARRPEEPRPTRPEVRPTAGAAPRGSASARTMPSGGGGVVWEDGAVVANRYEVRSTARGGMGLVTIAFDRELQRDVAVKTPLPSIMASEDGRARFLREAEAWIALGVHPNVCTAYYLQELDGLPRLFIEYVGGGDLESWLSRERRLTLEQRLDIAIQIAEGMAYTHVFEWTDESGRAHSGMLHRDLKPANVMMTLDGVARLTDFGLVRARAAAEPETLLEHLPTTSPERPPRPAGRGTGSGSVSWRTVTEAGGVVGTPPYLAPELWQASARASVTSDVYAYGCMLYEVFCGRRPFVVTGKAEGRQRQSVLVSWLQVHTTTPPPDPSILQPGVDEELGDLMTACVAKVSADRPQTFDDVAARLKGIYARLVGQPYPRSVPEHTLLAADSLNNRGASFVTLGQPARAVRAWREALDLHPTHREASFNLALWEWLEGRRSDAELMRHMAESTRGRGVDARDLQLAARLQLNLGNPATAVEALRRARAGRSEDPGMRRDLGLSLAALASTGRDGGVIEECLRSLEPLAAAGSCEPEVLLALGEMRRRSGRGDEAAAVDERARAWLPGLPQDPSLALAVMLPGWEERRVIRQPGKVTGVAVTPAGSIVSRCESGVLAMSRPDDELGHGEGKAPGQSTRGVSVVALPSGSRLLVASHGQPVGLVDLGDHRASRRFRPHPGYVTSLAAGPDGQLALSGGSDRRVRLWEVPTGECRATLEGHDAYVGAVAFLPTGGHAVSGSGDGTVRVWDLVGESCLQVLRGHSGAVDAVAVLADGDLVASGAEDGILRVWELSSGECMHALRGHGGAVVAAAAMPDGRHVLSAGADQTLRCWDAVAGRVLKVWRLHHPVAGLAVHPDGPWAVVASGHQVDLLRVVPEARQRPPVELTRPLTARELAAKDRRFRELLAKAGEMVEAGEVEAAVPVLADARAEPGFERHRDALALWTDVQASLPRASLSGAFELHGFAGHSASVSGVVFGDGGRQGVSGSADGTLRVWDLVSGEPVASLGEGEDAVTCVAASDGGRRVALGRRSGTVCVVDPAAAGSLRALGGHDGSVTGIAMLGGWVLSVGQDGTLRRWPLEGDRGSEVLAEAGEALSAVAASPDGQIAVTGGWDRRLTVWSLDRRAVVQRCEGHQGSIQAVAVSPDGRRAASGSEDGTVRLWDLESGRCLRVLSGHEGGVQTVGFTPDARFVISGGRDGTMRVWSLRSAACVGTFEAATDAVLASSLSDDGGSLLTGGADGSIRQWFLDWEIESTEPGGWDDRVRPFLEVYWRSRPAGLPRGEVSDDDLTAVVEDLRRRGYGWISPHRLRRELEGLATGWASRESDEQQVLQQRAQRQALRQRAEPVRQAVAGATRNLGLKVAGGVAVVIAVVLGLLSLRAPGAADVTLNDSLRADLADVVRDVVDDLHTPGRARAFQGETAQVISNPRAFCRREDRNDYLDVALYPSRHTGLASNPGMPSTDPVFRQQYLEAVVCLAHLQDPELVVPVLRRAGSGVHPLHQLDLLRVLVAMDGRAIPALDEALGNGERGVRRSAALALLYLDREDATRLLLEAVDGGEPRRVEAASFVLRELIAVGHLPPDRAFESIQRLLQSIDPEVRANAVLALEMFDPSRPVMRLLDEADDDADAVVRRAAASTRKALREAARMRYLGRPGAPGG